MQVHVLASGSTGNATFVELGGQKLLVDAGVSARRIKNDLASVGVAVEELDGILVTHEHLDHIRGLPTLLKKYQLPVYSRRATFAAMNCRQALADGLCRPIDDQLELGGVRIEAFDVFHDAADPVGYSLYHGGEKCSVVTDVGFITASVKQAIAYADVLVLEANHDLELLRNGTYPWPLKRRIMSNRGHLSNTDAAWTLARMARRKFSRVFLAHLSQENNRPEIAQTTISNILREQGCVPGVDIDLRLTRPDGVASL